MKQTKIQTLAAKHGFEVEQRPKGSATLVFGGKKLAAAARKLVR